jgi:CBS domain-containing protein
MPVVEDREGMRLVGIVTDRDLVIRHVAEGHAEDCSVRQHMTEREEPSEFATARPEDTVEYVMELMTRHQVRRIPVVAEGDQRLTGIIALADVSREVGPRDPAAVVRVLSDISEPATDRSPAPIG